MANFFNINEHLLFVHVSKFHRQGDLWETVYLVRSEKATMQIFQKPNKLKEFYISAFLLHFFNPFLLCLGVVGLIFGGDEVF